MILTVQVALCLVPVLGLASDNPNTKFELLENFVADHCLDCHGSADPERGFDLESFDFSAKQLTRPDFDNGKWETMLRRLDSRQMPPPAHIRPAEKEYQAAVDALTEILDSYALAFPNPGTTSAIRRLTRTEYQNVIRDLLAVEIDAEDFLPADQSSHGFDNITVEGLSPTLINRYLSAAQKISRAAVGASTGGPTGVTIRIPADRTQENHVEGLPFGTRGGILFKHQVTSTADYEFEIKLARDRDEKVEGLHRKQDVHILVDRILARKFTVTPPPGKKDYDRDFTHVDSHLKVTLRLTAGTHEIGVTFPKMFSSLHESKRQPFDASYNRHRHPRRSPAIYQVSIVGPFDAEQPGDSESRLRIFGEQAGQTRQGAQDIIARLARMAYRRPVEEADLQTPLNFFDQAIAETGNFDAAIERALAAILVNPNFLLRIERQPAGLKPGQSYAISDFELASRLSFFLWSSLPDHELLDLAEKKQLQRDDVLARQVKRMLADPKAVSLATNFASQWLYLKNLDSITPDLRLFPDFDDNLRQSFRRETELLFFDVLQSSQSVSNLLRSDYTFLNERLAKHYGIGGVLGSHFRRHDLAPDSHRGGILRHGSVLTVTSYATRTSPTIRGNWILENIIGTPPPPPPPDVPDLKENTTLNASTIRQRLALHRANPACASCHDIMDPVGFSLENYDAVGRWREFDGDFLVDSRGQLPDGQSAPTMDEFESGLLLRPELFARTLAEKLLTYAIGRGVESYDASAIRKIVRDSAANDYLLAEIVTGVVLSEPFRKRSVK